MSEDLTFLTGIGISAMFSLAVAWYLQRHLRSILGDLCGTRERADFWTAFSNVTLLLVPLICALAHSPQAPQPSLLLEIADRVKWALIGLVAAVFLMGFVLSWFILGAAISTGRSGDDGGEREPKGA